jgi:hypothetical protein
VAATSRAINLNLARRPGGGRPSQGTGRAQTRPPLAMPVNLGALFEMECRVRGLESALPPPAPAPRSQEDAEEWEEKWQFRAEILCIECNFLQMEREVVLHKLALRKLDRHRGQMCGVCPRHAACWLTTCGNFDNELAHELIESDRVTKRAESSCFSSSLS